MHTLTAKLQRPSSPAAFKQTRTAFALKIATLIAATVTIFYGDLALIFNEALQNETTIYLLIVPFTVALLTYRKRKMLRAVMPLSDNHQQWNMRISAQLTGILLSATATMLYWPGSYAHTPMEPYAYAFTPIASHILALPILVIGLILILFNPQTLRQLALPIALLFFLAPPPPETLARLLLTGFILILMVTTVILTILDRTSRTHIPNKTPLKCNQCNSEPPPNRDYCTACSRILHPKNAKLHKTDTAKILAIILIVAFLATIQAPVFAINKRIPISVTNTPSGPQYSMQILPEIEQYSLTPHPPLATAQNKANPTSTGFEYTNATTGPVYVTLEISSSSTPPPFNPYSSSSTPVNRINYTSLSNIGAKYFLYYYPEVGLFLAVVYWYSSPVFIINQTAQQKTVETILEAYPNSTNDALAVERRLASIATQIINYWMPNETWPETTAHFLSQNGITLSAATSIAFVVTLFYYTAETRRRRKERLAAVSKLNALDAEIVKALQTTRRPVTVGNLMAELQKKTGQTITLEKLDQNLTELENVGIIESQVSSQNNRPIQTWKA